MKEENKSRNTDANKRRGAIDVWDLYFIRV